MRGKLRQWMVDNPRGMTAAYALTTVGTYAIIGTNAAGGAATGP